MVKTILRQGTIHSPRFKPWAMDRIHNHINRFNGFRLGIYLLGL